MGCCRSKIKKTHIYPTIVANDREANKNKGFCSNEVTTTKYTPITFLPKNLFEQFRRVTNIYFLIMCIISVIPQISPLLPVSVWVPLIFVLAVSAVKDAFEDAKRRSSDNKLNNRLYNVLQGEDFVNIKNKYIQVGDIIKLYCDEEAPADMLILKSSDENGLIYVDTANLDGETNLKVFKARPETKDMDIDKLLVTHLTIDAEANTTNLYKFKGTLHINDKETLPLSEQNLMLRGTKLRNLEYCIGVVIYTGKNSKIMLNANSPPSKWSQTERKINVVVLTNFIIQLICCTVYAILHAVWESRVANKSHYLEPDKSYGNAAFRGFLVFFSYLAIFSYFIPISLIVTLELAKLAQAVFIMWDIKCVNEETGEGISVKNSNLNDELSRASYIFCDKTGTLTENKMEFDRCTIYQRTYNETRNKELLSIVEDKDDEESRNIKEYLTILGICNTAIPEYDSEVKKYIYQAQSPDEICLCNFSRDNGVILKERKNTTIVVDIFGENLEIEILNVLEFDSNRKRMSIIVKYPDGNIMLYSKGADSIMFERLSKDCDNNLIKKTKKKIDKFASEGLRTLLVCKKSLTKQEYKEFASKYDKASTLIEGREEEVERVQDEIERDLILVGSTAIEDKLQVGVPETISKFIEAGIKVWIITGDKQDTAINIATSCNLIRESSNTIIFNCEDPEKVLRKLQNSIESAKNNESTTLVIDGPSLPCAMAYKSIFLELCKLCESVVCCRASPNQKALLVNLIKKGTDEITLSVGDGANDVSMLMEAHIGVGIFGKEGSQAARSSDYAIHMFKDLQRLVFIHGRYNLIRSSTLINYCFYKNLAVFLVQVWFAFYCGFSAQTIYDSIIMAIYNVVITSLPPLIVGIFEKDVHESKLEKYPQALKEIREGVNCFTAYNFTLWLISSIYHSLIIFFLMLLFVSTTTVSQSGKDLDIWEYGTMTSTIGVIIVLLKFSLSVSNWDILMHIAVWGSMLVYFLLVLLKAYLLSYSSMWRVFHHIFSTPSYIFMIALTVIIALLPDFVVGYLKRLYYPNNYQILQELEE